MRRSSLALLAWTVAALPAAAQAPFEFREVTAHVALEKVLHGAFVHAIAWGDFDDDGRPDLFLGTFADRSPRFGMKQVPPNMLFRQVAGGKFERFPCPAVEVPMRCSGAVFADLDNDGHLDLYVSSNTLVNVPADQPRRLPKVAGSRLYRNDGGGRFVDVSKECGACPADLIRCRDIGVLDYDGDGLLDLLIMQDGGVNPEDKVPGIRLFRNRGRFRFEDVTRLVRLPGDVWGAGIAVADLNSDRRPDFYICGGNRLFLSQADKTYKEALRAAFKQPEKELDWLTGAAFGDLDRDGDLDLVTGRHHYLGPSRVHVYVNDGLQGGVPQFREVTKELGLTPLPQKTPHPEIQDFDNDGIPDLYWSTYFGEGERRWPFICKGLGVKEGLPRFAVPSVADIKPAFSSEGKIENLVPEKGRGMVYYVNGPAVDFDSDGRLDFLAGNWPPEGSRFFRNETRGGNWLQVRVEGKKTNRMGIGAQIRAYASGKAGEPAALLGFQEITVNGGYSSSKPAVAHFGLGKLESCDLHVIFPTRAEPVVQRRLQANQAIAVREP
jgi:hypothetical protein